MKEASDHFHIAALSGKERVHIYVNTTIFATHADPKTASRNLQEHLFTIQNWLQKWKIKVNETKSSHITFTLRKDNCPAISINQTVLPQVESVKYLGLHFDRRLNWKVHITKKRKQTDLTHCGWVTQICVFNTVKLGTSASSP